MGNESLQSAHNIKIDLLMKTQSPKINIHAFLIFVVLIY